jgi:hypothetical protein
MVPVERRGGVVMRPLLAGGLARVSWRRDQAHCHHRQDEGYEPAGDRRRILAQRVAEDHDAAEVAVAAITPTPSPTWRLRAVA